MFFALASQKSCFLEAEVSRPAGNRLSNDQVIKEVDLQDPCAGNNSFRELHIGLRRTRIARGVIVYQHESKGRMDDRRTENFAGMRKRCVHRSLGNLYLRNSAD